MLAAFRRLFLSGGNSAARSMTSTSGPSLEDTLFACLCPDQGRYGPQHAALLANRLREVAQSLDSTDDNAVEEPAPKKARKEGRNRGRGGGGNAPITILLQCSPFRQRAKAEICLH